MEVTLEAAGKEGGVARVRRREGAEVGLRFIVGGRASKTLAGDLLPIRRLIPLIEDFILLWIWEADHFLSQPPLSVSPPCSSA